ncbi:MAG: hypothetical protein WAU70_09650 [Flavobacteriales bacterium]
MILRTFIGTAALLAVAALVAQPAPPTVPLGLKTKDVMGRALICDIGNAVYDVVIGSDTTFYWKDHKTGHEEHDRLRKVDIDDHSALLGWVENDSTFVSMFIDTQAGTAHAVYFNKDRKVGSFNGNLELGK